MQKGNIGVTTENIFPIIKKFLYSDHEIFLRELVSNAVDATQKLKTLASKGEFKGEMGDLTIKVSLGKDTITISDRGIGLTAEEIDKYINQIAFSGANDFLEKYKDDANAIIGHFGLGFYSAFMVAKKVEIITKSHQEGAQAVKWTCDGSPEFTIENVEKESRGSDIILYIDDDCKEFLEETRISSLLTKYCRFLPIPIAFGKKKEWKDGKQVETNEDNVINETYPLWTRKPVELKDEDYKKFYRELYPMADEPLFWIHLNVDYPFNLTGILYFPKINMEYEFIEGTIKLYNNQVFIADNIKEVIPEFLLLLKGVIDCPDLPLNVSRSALQNDGFVKKIAEYITKKVADKLAGMCKTDKEEYDKYWDDISPFIKFGCLKDDKFCEKMNDYILFKNLDGKYLTLPECLEIKPQDEEENKENAVDENGNKVEAEVVGDKSEDEASEENAEEEKKEKTIYYVTDEQQQSQYINMFKAAKMDAVILTHNIDQPFISQLEQKNEGIKFQRIDADVTDALKSKTSKKAEKEMEEQAESISKLMKKALKNDKITVKVEKLKNKKISSMITLSEESRRMQDMMKMYSMPGMDMSAFGGEGETLILNASHPLVQYITEHQDGENAEMICEQLYDLAKLQHAPLSADAMTKFVARSNDIMMLLIK